MKTKFFIFLAAVLLFASCEKVSDDRMQPVPENVKLAWILSVEVDKLPSGTQEHTCYIYEQTEPNEAYEFTKEEVELPELFKISGGALMWWEGHHNRQYIVELDTYEVNDGMISVVELAVDTLPDYAGLVARDYPTQLIYSHPDKSVTYKVNLRYD